MIGTQHTLSEKEQAFYQDQGYLLTRRPMFYDEKFQKLNSIFEEHLAMKKENPKYDMDVPHFTDKRLFEFLMAPEVLSIVEGIIGPDIGLWSSHFICKEPFFGKRTPWHEDSGYWQGRFDNFNKVVTVWLAIDQSTMENGCMGVVPGTHANGFSDYGNLTDGDAVFDSEIKTAVNEDEVVWFELEKGQYSLHDSRIIHGARANESPKRRTGYTMRYFSTNMKLNREHPGNANHKIYHCQGENRGNNPLLYLS